MKKRHVLVVGGSKGVGCAVAQMMAQEGCVVSVVSRTKPQRKCKGVLYRSVDITRPDCLLEAFNGIVRQNGKLSHIIFCQQFRGEGDDWSGQMETSLTATRNIIELSMDCFEGTVHEKSIVVVGSIASRLIAKEQPISYHVAKAGLEQVIRYYAFVLGGRGIRVNGVSPNTILKEENKKFYLNNKRLYELYKKISPLRKMVTAEDVAQTVIFLCSPRASSITGQNIVIDAGVTLQEHASLARTLVSLDKMKIIQKASGRKN